MCLADSIQNHADVFLDSGSSNPGAPAPQTPSETELGGGQVGVEEVVGGRRASMTSVDSEMLLCSVSQLGSTVADSE